MSEFIDLYSIKIFKYNQNYKNYFDYILWEINKIKQ